VIYFGAKFWASENMERELLVEYKAGESFTASVIINIFMNTVMDSHYKCKSVSVPEEIINCSYCFLQVTDIFLSFISKRIFIANVTHFSNFLVS
jgi:hypothetical protein